MLPINIKPDRLLALGVVFVLSLTATSVILLLTASAQCDVSSARQPSKFEVRRFPLQEATVRVEPAVSTPNNGETFRIYITIEDAVNLGAFAFSIDYDPAIVEVPTSPPVTLGSFLTSTGRTVIEVENDVNPATGVITYGAATYGSAPGPDGDGTLAFIEFRARDLGIAALDLKDVELTQASGYTQGVSVGDGLVVVANPPDPAQVSINKSVDAPTVAPQGVLTYTLRRSFVLAGRHSYDEIVFDPIPNGTTYLSANLNGQPAPELYSAALDAIYYQHNGSFTDTEQCTITFQVKVGSLPDGSLIVNTVTETVSFDEAAYSGPYTSTSSATVTCIKPAAPSLSTPVNGSSTCDRTPHFSWSSVNGATSYRIQVDDNSSFSSPEIDTTTSNPEYTPASALSPGTYYWHVQASNLCGDGQWSVTWEFTIEYCIYLPLMMKNH